VLARDVPRGEARVREYLLNNQAVFSLGEEVRGLARLRASVEPAVETARAQDAPAPAVARPCLVLVKGLDEGRAFPLRAAAPGERRWVIGRRRDADIALDYDPYVSSEHALVAWDGAAHRVEDLAESRNGTTLNLARLPNGASRVLRHGDLLGVGSTLLLYWGPSPESSSRAAPPR
jgi:FHA domain